MGCTLQSLPRCGAWARSTGRCCLQRAMANGRCYIHGGKAKIKHGRYTKQAEFKRKKERQQIKQLRDHQIFVERSIS